MPSKAPSKTKNSTNGSERRHKTSRRDDDTTTDRDDDWINHIKAIKPADQLQNLTEQELNEEHVRVLTATDPHAPQNLVRFDFKERQFKAVPVVSQLAIHFSLEGRIIAKDSDEARRQLQREKAAAMEMDEHDEVRLDDIGEAVDEDKDGKSQEEAELAEMHLPADEGAAGGAGECKPAEMSQAEASLETSNETRNTNEPEDGALNVAEETVAEVALLVKKKPPNQFNYSERASQTHNSVSRDRQVETEPPPRSNFSGQVSQWEIYDAYTEEHSRLEASKAKQQNRHADDQKRLHEPESTDINRVKDVAKLMERMVNQNIHDDILHDFKYFEDVTDELKPLQGTLLPLLHFSYEKLKKLSVTALQWNTRYTDLFAVGYGSYDYQSQGGGGMLLLFSLKNTSHPEYIYPTSSGVLSIDTHPDFGHMICAGFYDGSVAVFNLASGANGPSHRPGKFAGRHSEPVWQVSWQKNNVDNAMNFCSVSSDGRVISWTLAKNELQHHDLLWITLPEVPTHGPDGAAVELYGGGTTFAFQQHQQQLQQRFLVGTAEGKVHVCCKLYSSTFLSTFNAHSLAIYRVAWNPFHERVFITCSDDWTVKIFDDGSGDSGNSNDQEALFTFDLNCAVQDVAWSPYSSTVFAAVTIDGKVHVFDLNVNKYEPMCSQLVTPKKNTKLTHVEFNKQFPVLLVGDDRGVVRTFKLSPNLRKMPKARKELAQLKASDLAVQRKTDERDKLAQVLNSVRVHRRSPAA